jgi:hypothetical protein
MKYLGVIFDQKMLFHSHLQYIIKKETNVMKTLFSIAKRSRGASYKYIRQLFQAIIVPRIDYAASIWHRPKQDGSTAGYKEIVSNTKIGNEGNSRML